MQLISTALIFAVVSCAAVAQEISDRARETNSTHDLERQTSALKRIQDRMSEIRAESKSAKRVVADAEPASR